MLASPSNEVYGMVTSGGSFMFVKLIKADIARYVTSDIFDVRNRGNELYDVLQILKKLAQITQQ
jgi:hypothetical protein